VNPHATSTLIDEIRPDYIYHLAGESSVKLSWSNLFSLLNNNVIATLNLLEAIRARNDTKCKILLACSSEEYGIVDSRNIPIQEDTPLKPVSPYAVSKATVDLFGYQYYKSYGLSIIRIRAFNHTGPRRPEIYALSNFAKQIVEIEKNKKEAVIKVGNLNVVRDYTDVRDVVRGYVLAMEHCKPGEVYNLCSSKGYKLADLLDILISQSEHRNIKIIRDDSRMRPVDSPIIIGSNAKFKQATAWSPEFNIEQTFQDMLNYWRSKV
ncbi:MAG TPA: NAD-dependent epimerase/dehydratase family protein, partial [Thermoplasmatales archaeon]|nr:NAD-dependent epimerase/dehydratase family protein [Thermoplasmatales archaeon]